MKDTLKQLLTDCLSASKKGGPGGGVDPSKFPSQVCYQCSFFDCRLSNVFLQNLTGKSVSDFSTLPFHVSGFTLLLLYVIKSSLKLQCLLQRLLLKGVRKKELL